MNGQSLIDVGNHEIMYAMRSLPERSDLGFGVNNFV